MDDLEHETTDAKKSRTLVQLAVSFALVAALSFIGGLVVGGKTNTFLSNIPLFSDGLLATPDATADLGDFWKVWNVLEDRFVETHGSTTPNTVERLWGAMEGLTASYGDPYTVFMRPEDAKIFAEDIAGNFSGVGMEIGIKDNILTVIAPLKGTPAERAGIRTGDQVLLIDDTSTEGMSTDEAVKIIRGEKGTTVTFKILRGGSERLEIAVVRDTIHIPTIETATEDGVFVISFYSFSANSGSLFSRALAEFRQTGSRLLLVDLRGNPGGYLESAVSIAGNFLPDGTVVVTEDYNGNQDNIEHRSRGTGALPAGTKVAILIDGGSASASEILAGALQDEGVATIIGSQSFGKGSVQELVKVGSASLKVTVARWLTPSGRSISDGGLTPDIEVAFTPEAAAAGEDPQKVRAIQFLKTGE